MFYAAGIYYDEGGAPTAPGPLISEFGAF